MTIKEQVNALNERIVECDMYMAQIKEEKRNVQNAIKALKKVAPEEFEEPEVTENEEYHKLAAAEVEPSEDAVGDGESE